MGAVNYNIRITAQGRVLVDVRDFTIPLNQITILFGESGIGKSLIARAIYGLLDPEEFDIEINGNTYEQYLAKEAREIKKNSFFVFQEPSSHLNPLLPLGTQLREGDLSGAFDDSELMKELWNTTSEHEIENFLAVYPKSYRPSGGEKQRLFLAMALKKIDIVMNNNGMNKPALFVFDEPTGSLDNYFRNVFLSQLLQRFRTYRFAILLITHDYSMVSEMTGKHRSALNHISFKELSRQQSGVALKDFKPEVYIDWLEDQRKNLPTMQPTQRRESLLNVESGAEVFGRQLILSKDREGKEVSSLEVFSGAMTYLKAPSGAGKTSLVKMVMGLIRGDKLRANLGDAALTEHTPKNFWQTQVWGRKMTMVFQHADEALNPRSTVEETFHGLPTQKRITQEAIRETLSELFQDELSDNFLKRHVSALSGGQKQRLNLLRGLFLHTNILILDEPLNGLDFESATKVLGMLREQLQAGIGILLISHNEEIFDAVIPKEQIYYLQVKMLSKVKDS